MQIQLYKEDFSIERRDRERAQSEKDYLQQQLKDAQEIIATLTQEVNKLLFLIINLLLVFILFKYSGTPLIRSPIGQKNLTIISR